jgi:glycerol kinase
MRRALASSNIQLSRIAALGITNQRETTVVWDKHTLRPVHNAIVWQCRRSAGICETLKAEGLEGMFRERTGLLLNAYFSGTKLKWLRDGLGLVASAAETQALAESVVDTQGVHLVPAFAGLGAPHWDMHARGGLLPRKNRCWKPLSQG